MADQNYGGTEEENLEMRKLNAELVRYLDRSLTCEH